MVCFQYCRLVVLLGPLLLAAACGSGNGHATRDLNDRLQARLAQDIAAGQVTLQPLADGARVTLPEASTYADYRGDLVASGQDSLAGVIEGLLDPSLMRIALTETSMAPEAVREARVESATRYFVQAGLGPSLQPPAEPMDAAPAGLTITIGVQCPGRHHGSDGYQMGQRKPRCH